ncbi:hypothetical protein [Azospirillum halopraeferens]|uniref:hypothetical protein n=1 Tax=Azospirillum halopraeferens TaxID=34010 RepID=UPI0003F639C8|nr:hypothetical protein [Azospirillum halopraeferens]
MTDDEFRALLDRHGGDPERWPRPTLGQARRLLARSPVARAMLDEMVAIELALAESDCEPAADLADRIFDAAFGTDAAPGDGVAGTPEHRRDVM